MDDILPPAIRKYFEDYEVELRNRHNRIVEARERMEANLKPGEIVTFTIIQEEPRGDEPCPPRHPEGAPCS